MTNWVPSQGFTVAPLETTESRPPDPEFIRLPKPGKQCLYCGLGRGALYSLINEGRIHSVTLRKRGRERGVRLIYYPSLRDYLHRLLKEQILNINRVFLPSIIRSRKISLQNCAFCVTRCKC